MRYRRFKHPGGCYFFTVNLLDRKRTYLTEYIDQLRKAFSKVKIAHSFEIDAIVILPDHLHAMLTLPLGDAEYSQRWNLIKGCFSRGIGRIEEISSSRQNKRERGIWQRRFWEHMIRDDRDYERHINYIHYNPVKNGYVDNPVDWEFSSIHGYIATGVLPANWGSQIGFSDADGAFGE